MPKRGFTLIELVIVVFLTGIISIALVIALTNSMRASQLNSAAERVVSDLRYAQALAGETGQWHGANFEINPVNRYSVYITDGTVDTLIMNPAKFGSNLVVDLGAEYTVQISSVNIAGGSKVEFSPLGVPYNDKTGSPLAALGAITLSKDSQTRIIRITPNTGRIYIE